MLTDLEALKRLFEEDKFEKDITRIGAEQEFCLIDYSLRPAMKALKVLDHLNDDHFTMEPARFNTELQIRGPVKPLPYLLFHKGAQRLHKGLFECCSVK